MIETKIVNNYKKIGIENVFEFLELYMKYRFSVEFHNDVSKPPIFQSKDDALPLNRFVVKHKLSDIEVMILLLSIVSHISPTFLKSILLEYLSPGGEFTDFGGAQGKYHRGILPTGETALYIAAGNSLNKRIQLTDFLLNKSILFTKKIIFMEEVPRGEPKMSGKLIIDEEYLELFTSGKILKPMLSQNFPASIVETGLEWKDLVLQQKTLDQIKEIDYWLQYNEVLLQQWNLKNKIKPGYRVMLIGPSGTGKTLTASLLGKYAKRDVYRIDLSMVVSKFIGETEKNLAGLFDKAIDKKWILFFDEADAIFGKRTNVRDAHDKYANQEVSYLLQRIESHPGLVILASNFKNNIDIAFTRRFQSIIEFQLPGANERLRLWKNNLPENIVLKENISLDEISKKYALTGANIINIIQYVCLKTLAEKTVEIELNTILEGIKKEYLKEGKTISI